MMMMMTAGTVSLLSVVMCLTLCSAPEVYFGEKYSTKSDVFSVGVILWELTYRTMKGEYLRPYKEFPKIKIDFHIIINSAKKGLRPTIPEGCPEKLAEVIRTAWVCFCHSRCYALFVPVGYLCWRALDCVFVCLLANLRGPVV